MPGPGNPVFSFRFEETRAAALREVAILCGYEHAGDLIREILASVMDRNLGQLHRLLRKIDHKVGVQLDLQLMSQPGGPVLSQKRVKRALRAEISRKGVGPP